MNRRAFLKRFGGGLAAAVALMNVPALLAPAEPTRLFTGPLMFKGVPVVYDQNCPSNRIYFINPTTLRAWDTGTGERIA